MYIVEGRQVPAQADLPTSLFNVAESNFVRTMQIPLLAGRYFNETDKADSVPVAVINESVARKWWPNEGTLGKRIKRGSRRTNALPRNRRRGGNVKEASRTCRSGRDFSGRRARRKRSHDPAGSHRSGTLIDGKRRVNETRASALGAGLQVAGAGRRSRCWGGSPVAYRLLCEPPSAAQYILTIFSISN